MRKHLIPITAIILIVSALLIFNNTVRYELVKRINMISAGSYAFTESYYLPYSEASVIKTIEKFKEKNSKYQVPAVSISSNNSFILEDSRSENGLWFVTYFYDPTENRILNIAIRGNKTSTILEFASINNGLKIGHWKDINRDFSYDENQKLKKLFEESYLNKIKKLLKNN